MFSHGQGKGNKSLREKLSLAKYKKFESDSVEDYLEKIKRMNMVDLCSHAIEFNIRANVDRKRMEACLLKEYKKAKTEYMLATGEIKSNTSEQLSDKQKRILEKLAFIK